MQQSGNKQDPLRHESRRRFVIKLALLGSGVALSANADSQWERDVAEEAVAFDYGVASGDPLADRVILWTHASLPDARAVHLRWQVAKDAGFTNLVATGSTIASAATGHTVKVDALGLQADSDYFYRFIAGQRSISPVGRTRTLPQGRVDQVKLAVFSCSNYPAGYFHAFDAAVSSGAQFALHLGDYIYEYADGVFPARNVGARLWPQPGECVSLDQYRARYAITRSDPALRALHARMPMIAIWDDHEFANNSYMSGAQNHDPEKQGPWQARKAVAAQAWQEWLPVRMPEPDNPLKIYRSFDFGDLLSLHMLDTRIVGREVSPSRMLNRAGQDVANPDFDDANYVRNRHMLGPEQQGWLTEQMHASRATWQVLGNQIVMARMRFPRSVYDADFSPDSVAAYLHAQGLPEAQRTGAEQRLLDPEHNPQISFDVDCWEGYPDAREALFAAAAELAPHGKKFLVLSGDSHNAWVNRLTLQGGQSIGLEFACPSVTSSGFESYIKAARSSSMAQSLKALVPDIDYVDTARRGFMLVTLHHERAECEFVYVSGVTDEAYRLGRERVSYGG
jgi:alkaline phosphatase D